ncbi:hypothetical protein [Streptomyces axinellae]
MAAVALVSAALMAGGAASSYAAQNTGTGTSGSRSESGTGARPGSQSAVSEWQGSDKGFAAARWASCTAAVNNPHWSKKGKSVIFKTRVSCQGNIAQVHVKVTGKLYRKSGSKWKAVAGSSETKVKATNGAGSTYYTPRPSGKKVNLDGTYQGKITVQITSPFPGTKGKASSKAVKVNTPGK